MSHPLIHPSPPAPAWFAVDIGEVERLMLDLATGARFERLGVIAREHLHTGGKRLRARLALATCQALGGDPRDAAPWAAAAELLHNATLVHDDVQDGDPMRRGAPAVWAKHGVAQAINVGDLMLMLPFRAVERIPVDGGVRWELASALARCAEEVVRGQAAELDLLPRERLEWEAYRDAVTGKTSALFSLPVYGGARVAGLDHADARALADAVQPIGLLFQIADDVLDLYGDKGREAPGADLREGKVSALVVEHLRLHPSDRAWLLAILQAPREQTGLHDTLEAIARFRDRGALDAAWDRMRRIESEVARSPALTAQPHLLAAAIELMRKALAPIAHCEPGLVTEVAK